MSSLQPRIPEKIAKNIDYLAHDIFRRYNDDMYKRGSTPKYLIYEDMPEDLRYSNIRQALTIPIKLD